MRIKKDFMKQGDLLIIKYKLLNYTRILWALGNYYLLESDKKKVIISSIRKYQNKYLYELKLIRLNEFSKILIRRISQDLLKQKKSKEFYNIMNSFDIHNTNVTDEIIQERESCLDSIKLNDLSLLAFKFFPNKKA